MPKAGVSDIQDSDSVQNQIQTQNQIQSTVNQSKKASPGVFHFGQAFREEIEQVNKEHENIKKVRKSKYHSFADEDTGLSYDNQNIDDELNAKVATQPKDGDIFAEDELENPEYIPKSQAESDPKNQKLHQKPAFKTFAVALLISGILIMSAGYLSMSTNQDKASSTQSSKSSSVVSSSKIVSKSSSEKSSSSSSSIDPQVFKWQAESKLINDYIRKQEFFMGDLYVQGLMERGIKLPINLDPKKAEVEKLTGEYKTQYENKQKEAKNSSSNNSNSGLANSNTSNSNASNTPVNSSNNSQSQEMEPKPGSLEYIKKEMKETKKPVFEIIPIPEKLEDKEAEPKTKLEKQNLLVFPKYGVEVPIVYLEFDDLYRRDQNGDIEFGKAVDYPLDRAVCRQAAIYKDTCSPVQKKLEKGAVQTPFSVNAGDVGNSYLSAHTSNWNFIESPYNAVFKPIEGKGEKGDVFYVYDAKGRKLEFSVFETLEIRAEDGNTAYKEYSDKRVVTLQGSVLKTVGGVLSPTHRWLIRGEIKG